MAPRKPKDAQEENRIFEVEDANEVEAALRELPNEEDTISLFRMHDQGRPKFIDKFYPQEFDLKVIKAKYGGGRFKACAVVGDSQVTKIFEVEGDMILSSINSSPRNENGPGYWTKHEEKEKPYVYPNTFMEMQEKLKAIELAVNNKHPVNNDNGTDLLKVLLPFIMGNREDPKKTLFEELNLLKGLIAPSSVPNIETGIIMEAIKMGKDMSQGFNEDNGGGSRIVEVIEKLLNHPVTLGIINTVKNSQAGQTLRNPSPPVPSPDMLEPKQTLQPSTGFVAVAPMLQPYMPAFIANASANNDPNLLIDMALPFIPKDQYPVVIEWLRSPNWLKDLTTIEPKVEAYPAWFASLVEILLQALTEPEVINPPESQEQEV